jgi:hypothetical protein
MPVIRMSTGTAHSVLMIATTWIQRIFRATKRFVTVRTTTVKTAQISLVPSEDLDLRYSPTNPGAGILEANWTDDPGAEGFEVAIGTSPGNDDVMTWTDAGDSLSGPFGNLDLQGAWDGVTYYVSVRSYSGAFTCPEGTSDGVRIAEAETWTGDVSELRPPDALGGWSEDWPQTGSDSVHGEHWVQEVQIPADVTVYVQGWGRVDSVSEGVSAADEAVTDPADGWLTLWAENISVAGTITASGRGYGGGGSGGGTCGSAAARGRGGSDGRGGNGQLSNGGTIKLFYSVFEGTPLDPAFFGRIFDAE